LFSSSNPKVINDETKQRPILDRYVRSNSIEIVHLLIQGEKPSNQNIPKLKTLAAPSSSNNPVRQTAAVPVISIPTPAPVVQPTPQLDLLGLGREGISSSSLIATRLFSLFR
jgi:hypothetical protein